MFFLHYWNYIFQGILSRFSQDICHVIVSLMIILLKLDPWACAMWSLPFFFLNYYRLCWDRTIVHIRWPLGNIHTSAIAMAMADVWMPMPMYEHRHSNIGSWSLNGLCQWIGTVIHSRPYLSWKLISLCKQRILRICRTFLNFQLVYCSQINF